MQRRRQLHRHSHFGHTIRKSTKLFTPDKILCGISAFAIAEIKIFHVSRKRQMRKYVGIFGMQNRILLYYVYIVQAAILATAKHC